MRCGFCQREFEEDRGQPACQACPLNKACRYIRCPYCGYENPARPGWLERLGALVGRAGDGEDPREPPTGEAEGSDGERVSRQAEVP